MANEQKTKQNARCAECNKPMRKNGKGLRSGRWVQRWQCVNVDCEKFGHSVTSPDEA